jgi:hypothetical protein
MYPNNNMGAWLISLPLKVSDRPQKSPLGAAVPWANLPSPPKQSPSAKNMRLIELGI